MKILAHMRIWANLVVLTAVAIVAASAQSSSSPSDRLDYETFRTKVEPIFLKKRPTHARCVVCHTGPRSRFSLQELAEGQTNWTPEQSRQNFEMLARIINFENPFESAILKHPLAEEAGGDDFHSGGRQFASRDDPDWKAIADWIRAAK